MLELVNAAALPARAKTKSAHQSHISTSTIQAMRPVLLLILYFWPPASFHLFVFTNFYFLTINQVWIPLYHSFWGHVCENLRGHSYYLDYTLQFTFLTWSNRYLYVYVNEKWATKSNQARISLNHQDVLNVL